MAGELEASVPQPIQDQEPSHIHLNRPHHDRLTSFAKLIKTVQSKFGLTPHTPKEGEHAGQYYKVDRSQVPSKPDTGSDNQPLPEVGNS